MGCYIFKLLYYVTTLVEWLLSSKTGPTSAHSKPRERIWFCHFAGFDMKNKKAILSNLMAKWIWDKVKLCEIANSFVGGKDLKETFWVVSQSSDEYHNERKWRQTWQNRVIKNPDESTFFFLCYCSLGKESIHFPEGGVLQMLLWGVRSHLEWHWKSTCKTSEIPDWETTEAPL